MQNIAVDMDGTLLSRDGTISKENARAVKRWQENGNRFIIATGRGIADAKRLLGDVELEADGFVCANGSVVATPERILEQVTLSNDTAFELAEWLNERSFYFHISTENATLTTPETNHSFLQELDEFVKTQEEPERVRDSITRQANHHVKHIGLKELGTASELKTFAEPIYKFLVISFFPEKLQDVYEAWGERPEFVLTSSGRDNIEMMNPKAQKGFGLERMVTELGSSLRETVAIGDNFNDVSMFQAAGTSIAMENAEEAVKEQATYVTTNHDEAGVAYALENILTPNQSNHPTP
ncbi:Cof-type HAD-IIB family hydrolase [Salsuginibacillus kocurii]|uniref:Cof-type HAD-IIB family hydrolase n=1 Tax=Salsuginibacillus kocurii TaxID=427078 RepID=UPI000366E4B8|nr:Cof-type HAD-IIB family hydrolase [Salsuginibacillus kocurii]